ncbi:MAG: hypothetical protein JOS17DRAFT_440226 [Linnemannia elongata]|nr:MAG: hypothetical protein JOS17DRAFT_440226 [Linnemannia elongata]
MDGIATPSFMYHAASSSLSAPGSTSLRFWSRQSPPGRSHSLREGDGQQDRENVARSRSTSLDYSDLAPQYHQHQNRQQHQATTHTRNVRKRPSPSIPSKDGKISSSSSSSWWESPLTQQHAHSECSRFSPTRAFSPTSTRSHLYHHYHHQRQRSPPSFPPSSSSTSLTSVFSSVVPGPKAHQSGEGSTTGGIASGDDTATSTSAISGVAQTGGPSQTTPPPTSFSSTSTSSFSSSSTSSLPSSSATSFAVQDDARQRLSDRRNKRHMNLRAMMKERALLGDREAIEYVEHSHEQARRGCWPVDLDQDFDMDVSYYHHHQRTFDERGSGRDYYTNAEVIVAFGKHEMNDLSMDVDGGADTDEWIQYDSTTPIPTRTKSLSSSPSSPYLPVASIVSPQQQTNNKNNMSSSSSSKEPQLPTESSSSSVAGCFSHSPTYANWSVLPESEKDRENESAFGTTPLGISVPLIEANTNGSSRNGRWNGSENDSGRNGGDGGSLSSWRLGVTSELPSPSLISQGVSFRHPRGESNQQQQQLQSPLLRVVLSTNTTSSNPSTTAPSSISTTATTTTTSTATTSGTQQKMQQILNRNDKIAFLTKYTDRMHLKLQALGIEDWGQGDIQRKKTYQLMIQHNDKTGEKDLVKFYLGRYGGSVTAASGDASTDVQEPAGPLGLTLPLSVQQQQGQEQQGTPVVVQA